MIDHIGIKSIHLKKIINVINRLREQNGLRPIEEDGRGRSRSGSAKHNEEDEEEGHSSRRASTNEQTSPSTTRKGMQGDRRRSSQPVQKNVGAWRRGHLIGQGAYGKVYQGFSLEDGSLIAVKQILTTMDEDTRREGKKVVRMLLFWGGGHVLLLGGILNNVLFSFCFFLFLNILFQNMFLSLVENEISVMSRLKHDQIVRYLGYQWDQTNQQLFIFTEWVPGGSLSDILKRFGKLDLYITARYTKQMLLGLAYLHRHDVIHLDIKPGNVLIDNLGCVKLADFGASRKLVDGQSVRVGGGSGGGGKENDTVEMLGTPYFMAPEIIRQER